MSPQRTTTFPLRVCERPKFYILDEAGDPTPERDADAWARWFENANEVRVVRQEAVGDWWVSTCFLGMDHDFVGGPPLLFESMRFWRGEGTHHLDTGYQRCSTREEAIEMHEAMVQQIRSEMA